MPSSSRFAKACKAAGIPLFSPHDPEHVHEHIEPAEMAKILGEWKPRWIHAERSRELVGRLKAAFPGVESGVKDSAGNRDFTKSLLAAHRDLAILIGDERSLAAGVRLGGQGAISGMANLCPARMLAMTEEGRDDPALCAFVDELVKYPVISAIKAVVAQRTGDRIWRVARAPLPTLSDAEAGRIIDLYERMTLARAA